MSLSTIYEKQKCGSKQIGLMSSEWWEKFVGIKCPNPGVSNSNWLVYLPHETNLGLLGAAPEQLKGLSCNYYKQWNKKFYKMR